MHIIGGLHPTTGNFLPIDLKLCLLGNDNQVYNLLICDDYCIPLVHKITSLASYPGSWGGGGGEGGPLP